MRRVAVFRPYRRSMVLCLGMALFAAMLGVISGCGADDQESTPVSSTCCIAEYLAFDNHYARIFELEVSLEPVVTGVSTF
jgi:hypothetical protein